MKKKPLVFSLGGSVIVPDEINYNYLKKFKEFILSIKNDFSKIFIITGGGSTSRKYQKAAKKAGVSDDHKLDLLGIEATRLNAYLVKTIFDKKDCYQVDIIRNPKEKINFKQKIIVGAGWKPGVSSDFDTVLVAKTYKASTIINLSNVEYIYTKDPKKYETAQKIEKISWVDFRKIIDPRWTPGKNVIFDYKASLMAEKLQLKAVFLHGKNIKNIHSFLYKKEFKGTVVTP
jgi:uridylate kinase